VPGGAVGFKHIKTRETAEDCREKGKGDATGHRMVDQTDSARWRWFWEALGDWDLSSSQNYRNTGKQHRRDFDGGAKRSAREERVLHTTGMKRERGMPQAIGWWTKPTVHIGVG
jgi:hypothetical protein